MVERFNSKRVVFSKNSQKNFIEKAEKKISIAKMAEICGISERTIRDWRREKFLMDFNALQKICKKSRTSIPLGIKLKDKYWYGLKGASLGGKATWKKYGRIGNDAYRKKKWREWWEKEGKYKQNNIFNVPEPIKKPKFSKELAEFVGIILGDGGISKYQVVITLHSKDDKKYSQFVLGLIKKLFGVIAGVYNKKNNLAINLVVSRKELVRFCAEKLKLKQGNKVKQQFDIPVWIKNNKHFSIACLRGLFDTDGCIFNHRYKSNGRYYNYKKISFTSHSIPLLQSVFKILNRIKIKSRITKSGKDVRIDSQNDVKKYFKIVNSHNPKYLKKYQN